MADALSQAEADSGGRGLLARADSIRIPRGIWDYADPARLVADKVGATRAKTQVAEIGVLQTTLFGGAAQAIADGSADVVLIAGGEAKFRALRSQITGTEVPSTTQPEGTTPDEILAPHDDVITEQPPEEPPGFSGIQIAGMVTLLMYGIVLNG